MLTFLFTALIAAITYFILRPTPGRAVLLRCTLGVAALAKSVFVPFVVILPLVLVATRLSRPRAAVCAGLAAALWILPWPARNYQITESPLAFGPLFEIHRQRFEALVAAHPELSEKEAGCSTKWRLIPCSSATVWTDIAPSRPFC